jgi:hypothetical protein
MRRITRERIRLRTPQNATDGDVEVVFEIKGGDDGLTSLIITAPDGRRVATFTAPGTSTLGLRQFRLESPEPPDAARVLAAYPEGPYAFASTTADGTASSGVATLSRSLPTAATVLSPADGSEGVPITGLVVRWTPVPNVEAYVIAVQGPDPGTVVTARMPASATALRIPDGVLHAATEYQLAVGSVLADGNTAFVETNFTTDKE